MVPSSTDERMGDDRWKQEGKKPLWKHVKSLMVQRNPMGKNIHSFLCWNRKSPDDVNISREVYQSLLLQDDAETESIHLFRAD